MKKFFFLLLVTIVLVACSTGCGDINPPEPTPPVVVEVQKFKIVGIAGPNGTITPSSAIVEKGQSATFTMKADVGYEIEHLKDDGKILPPIDTYTVRDISGDDTFEVTFKKDSLLFPLLNITWKQDGLFIFLNEQWINLDNPYPEVVSFASDGKYTQVWNGKTYTEKWSLDKSKSPAILNRIGFTSFTIEVLNEKVMSISYINSQNIRYRYTYVPQ